ncbi:MAG: hypothetical protein AB7U83_23945 [Vicinamibacterales bacterium]
MTRRSLLAALALVGASMAPAFAHEGHDHKLLGTVTEVTASNLTVRAVKDGAVSVIAFAPTTKVTRGRTKLAVSDIKVGDRVVVNIGSGKAPLTAKAVELGGAPTTRSR